MDPNKIVVDFSANDDAWYDFVELSKFIATDNSITELDERLGQEFTALTLIDVCNVFYSSSCAVYLYRSNDL